MNPADIITKPIVTEKSTALGELGKYVFQVRGGASKQAIRRAVEAMFHVEVSSVNVMNMRGKPRRFGRFEGHRPGWRKAIVTLREVHVIEVVPGV